MLSSEILAKVTITLFRINLKFMRSSPFAYLARAFLMSVSLLAKVGNTPNYCQLGEVLKCTNCLINSLNVL